VPTIRVKGGMNSATLERNKFRGPVSGGELEARMHFYVGDADDASVVGFGEADYG
jgi:hypothetical protein